MTRNDDSQTEPDRQSTTRLTRRGVAAAAASIGTVGCLGLFGGDETTQTDAGSTYTTVPGTTTFAVVTGSRTPFPAVPPIRLGEGDLLVLFFDYDQQASIDWWRETYPEIEPLVRDGPIRLRFANYPVPVSRWSVQVPCALLEVRDQLDQAAAVEYHNQLIETAPDYSISRLGELAAGVGADRAAVERAARDRHRRAQLFSSRQFGRNNDIDTPPAGYTGSTVIDPPDAASLREQYATDG